MQYSPKLKTAAEEIKEVLKKYDIAGIIALHTPGYGEYVFHLIPSYSLVHIRPTGEFGIKTDAADTMEVKQQKISDTANMLDSLAQTTGHLANGTTHLLEGLSKYVDILRDNEGHSTHSEQNN